MESHAEGGEGWGQGREPPSIWYRQPVNWLLLWCLQVCGKTGACCAGQHRQLCLWPSGRAGWGVCTLCPTPPASSHNLPLVFQGILG